MRVDAKSALIGRKKSVDGDPDVRPCFISIFDGNNPHKSGEVPREILEYERVHRVIINGLDVNYLLPGNDLVINDLEHLDVESKGPHITISGKQKC